MINKFKNDLINFKKSLKSIEPLNHSDDLYSLLLNDLLIKIYSSFEQYNKSLLRELKQEIESDHRFLPISKVHKEINDRFVAPTKSENLIEKFTILKDDYFFEEYKNLIDSVVNERNRYAHQGNHGLSIEILFGGLVGIQYTVRRMYDIYIVWREVDTSTIDNLIEKEKTFINKATNLKNILTQQSGSKEVVSIHTVELFNKFLATRSDFLTLLDEVDSSNCYSIRKTSIEGLDEEVTKYSASDYSKIFNSYYSTIVKSYLGLDTLSKNISVRTMKETLDFYEHSIFKFQDI
ncbi:hypothetical protein ACXONV_00270 [Streptococcus thermophilus]|nr:hypothetical protein [Streptococcus thermophilus]